MKLIGLTRGLSAMVDDEDYETLNEFKWHARKSYNTFYASRRFTEDGKQKSVHMHRVVLGLTDLRFQGDHRDRNGLNNQRDNLRIVTNQENSFNTNAKGYYFHKPSRLFRARIKINGKHKPLGYHKTELAAHHAYLDAKKIYHVIETRDDEKK